MGVRLLQVSKPGRPFRLIEERINVIAPGDELLVPSREVKIVFYLEADHWLEIDGAPPVTVRSGDVFVTPRPCRQIYAPRGNSADRLHTLRIVFEEDWWRGASGDARSRAWARELRARLSAPAVLPDAMDAEARALLRGLQAECARGVGAALLRAAEATGVLLTRLVELRFGENRGAGKAGREGGRGQVALAAKDYLSKHWAERVVLDEVAWACRVSAGHLARVFRQETGQTLFAHLEDLRLDNARHLLGTMRATAAEVARRCGFGSAALFSRRFKQRTGMTPLSYRRSLESEAKFVKSAWRR